jgi:hypothetical protein
MPATSGTPSPRRPKPLKMGESSSEKKFTDVRLIYELIKSVTGGKNDTQNWFIGGA